MTWLQFPTFLYLPSMQIQARIQTYLSHINGKVFDSFLTIQTYTLKTISINGTKSFKRIIKIFGLENFVNFAFVLT